MAKASRSLHVLLADTHGGGKLALLPPDLVLLDENDDPWIPSLTASQEKIYEVFTRANENMLRLAGKDPVYVYHLGDVTHGNHHHDKELTSTRMSDHVEIAISNMSPFLHMKQVKCLLLIKGTGSHEFGQASSTVLVAKHLKELFKNKHVEAIGHALVRTEDGLLLDLAHHGPGAGVRNWTKGNVLRLYVRSMMVDLLQSGREVPNLVARAHFHQYTTETVNVRANGTTNKTEGLILPSFSFLDDYARKSAKSPGKVTVGCVIAEVVDGRIIKIHDEEPDWMETVELRKEISLGTT